MTLYNEMDKIQQSLDTMKEAIDNMNELIVWVENMDYNKMEIYKDANRFEERLLSLDRHDIKYTYDTIVTNKGKRYVIELIEET